MRALRVRVLRSGVTEGLSTSTAHWNLANCSSRRRRILLSDRAKQWTSDGSNETLEISLEGGLLLLSERDKAGRHAWRDLELGARVHERMQARQEDLGGHKRCGRQSTKAVYR